MPRTIAFATGMLDDSMSLHAEGEKRVRRLTEMLSSIGSGVFRYAFEPFESPDPFGTIWLMKFYDHKTFFSITSSQVTP